jgi:hypothetical protein
MRKLESGTTKFMRQDGMWQVPPNDNTTYANATTAAAGLMSSTDKTKLTNVNWIFSDRGAGYINNIGLEYLYDSANSNYTKWRLQYSCTSDTSPNIQVLKYNSNTSDWLVHSRIFSCGGGGIKVNEGSSTYSLNASQGANFTVNTGAIADNYLRLFCFIKYTGNQSVMGYRAVWNSDEYNKVDISLKNITTNAQTGTVTVVAVYGQQN